MEEIELVRVFKASPGYGYESLANNTLHDIREQQYASYPIQIHHDVTSFPLKYMREKFSEMPDDYKRVVIRSMSTQLLLLSCVAIYLPTELVKKHICLPMMDGEIASDLTQEKIDTLREKIGMAAEVFYTTPIGEAFDRYHAIKIWSAHNTVPIGPLYVLPQNKRDAILDVKSRWYSSVPVMSKDGKKIVNELDDDLKHMYLQGKEVVVVPVEGCRKQDLCGLAIMLLVGPCVFGCASGIGAAVGACCWGNPGCVCSYPFLPLVGSVAGTCSALACCSGSCIGLQNVIGSKRITI